MRRDLDEIAKFNALYDELVQDGTSYTKAYHAAEKVVRKREGRPFYKNYESFRVSRHHYLRRIRRNVK